jgi:hypothetical protein
MALPGLSDVKAYLRIQDTAEDTLLAALLASAEAAVRGALGRDIEVTERTFVDHCENGTTYRPVRVILIPPQYLPLEVAAASSAVTDPVVEDVDGTVLDPDVDYREPVAWESLIRARPGITFDNPPYTVTVNCGLAADAAYAARIEPALFQAILDAAADLYQRRSPAATSETAGGGVSTSYTGGLPSRVRDLIAPWVVVRVP